MKIYPSPENLHIQLLRAREHQQHLHNLVNNTTNGDAFDMPYHFAQGVRATLEWLLNDGQEPLANQCEWD